MKPKPKPVKGGAIMLVGGLLALTALGLFVFGMNAVAYLLGAGEEVTVTVTESSYDGGTSRTDEAGWGYYEQDGQRYEVFSSHMEAGEEIETRLPLIPLAFGSATGINANDDAAYADLTNFIGVAVVGVPGFIMLVGGWLIATKGVNLKNRRRARA